LFLFSFCVIFVGANKLLFIFVLHRSHNQTKPNQKNAGSVETGKHVGSMKTEKKTENSLAVINWRRQNRKECCWLAAHATTALK
jgi:hypothetical protein